MGSFFVKKMKVKMFNSPPKKKSQLKDTEIQDPKNSRQPSVSAAWLRAVDYPARSQRSSWSCCDFCVPLTENLTDRRDRWSEESVYVRLSLPRQPNTHSHLLTHVTLTPDEFWALLTLRINCTMTAALKGKDATPM